MDKTLYTMKSLSNALYFRVFSNHLCVMCIHMYVCVCRHRYICRSDDSLKCGSHLPLLRIGSFSCWPPCIPGWLCCELQRCSLSTSSLEKHWYCMYAVLCGFWGFQPRSSALHGEHMVSSLPFSLTIKPGILTATVVIRELERNAFVPRGRPSTHNHWPVPLPG